MNRRIVGTYLGEQPPGTIDVDPYAKFLYLVREGDQSVRYPIGAGRAGKAFAGNGTIQVKKKWPGWTPTANMLRTEPEVYGPFARGIPGGRRSPLGARALTSTRAGATPITGSTAPTTSIPSATPARPAASACSTMT
ncbi:MAG: hypothetical protein R3D63_12880 [Paracoccaceae bacterium]